MCICKYSWYSYYVLSYESHAEFTLTHVFRYCFLSKCPNIIFLPSFTYLVFISNVPLVHVLIKITISDSRKISHPILKENKIQEICAHSVNSR